MALYFDRNLGPTSGLKRVASTSTDVKRTHTKLIVSEGPVPAEKWLIDPRLRKLFKYMNSTRWVVLPKGRIVALATNGGVNDDGRFVGYINRFTWNALTIANGGVDVTELDKDGNTYTRKANVPVGVVPYNMFEQDELEDMADVLPTVVRDHTYIEVPLFTNKVDAEAIHWGSAYGTFKGGDMLCSDANGRFIKWEEYKTEEQSFVDVAVDSGVATVYVDQPIKPGTTPVIEVIDPATQTPVAGATLGDVLYASGKIVIEGLGTLTAVDVQVAYTSAIPQSPLQIVGKVCAVDLNIPPEGWLKWAEWALADQKTMADFDPTGFRPQDLTQGTGLTDGGYPYDPGYVDVLSKLYGPSGQGIPGLTDGSNIETQYTDEVIGEIQPNLAIGTKYTFRLKHRPAVLGSLTVKIGDTEVVPDYVDYDAGLVIIITTQTYSTVQTVTATYKATGQVPGLPTNWDFKGCVGGLRIMLTL
ncbi:MAG: hypothetical protein AB1330_01335 [Bacillota bacterium]